MIKLRDVLGPSRNIFFNLSDNLTSSRHGFNQGRKLRLALYATSTTAQPGQSQLPHLPVPALHETLDKYIKSVKPLITDAEYSTTTKIVKDFGASGGVGEKLQALLEKKASVTENWLSEWWLNTAYMDFRWPVVVHSSPGLVFPTQKFCTQAEQLEYTAKLIAAALDYTIMVDQDQIPTEYMGKEPLDMSQYKKVLGTCRIPGITRDRVSLQDPCNPPAHIIIAHNNHFFKVTVWSARHQPLNECQILAQLQEVVKQSPQKATPIGILTTEHRDTWGKAHQQLACDVTNRASLSDIQTALFTVCIDGANNSDGSVNAQTAVALQMVHGGGSTGNAANRWYDSTIQFVIGREGGVGLTFEHSPAEGPPTANLMDFIVNYVAKNKLSRLAAENVAQPKRLDFVVPSEVKEAIACAESHLDALVNDLQMCCFTFSDYGKDFIKTQRFSPDSYIQMAIQLAFFRLHKEPGAHYESASVRKYLHGRTETIRSCSIESVAFACAMLDSNASVNDKVTALSNAINGHKKYTVAAGNGFGVDRHLLGLKLTSVDAGMELPQLYLDAGFKRSTHFRISTSQVAAKCDGFMCYGPLTADGYACCYNPRDKEMIFGTSAFRSDPETDATKFKEALETSFRDMHDVLLKSQAKSKL